jgi:ferredoxin
MCVRACPTGAVCFRYGFGDGKEAANETTKEAVNETTKKTTKKTNMEESK